MEKFLTYFDLLGYKEFILNNSVSHVRKRIGHVLRDIELSMGQGKITKTDYGIIGDISAANLHCLNISDTIIFWTNDNSLNSFKELLKVSFEFNYRLTCYHFPVRGAMYYGEFQIISGYQETKNGGTYNVNSIFGSGLVHAHLKAENLNLATCVIDDSVIEILKHHGSVNEIIGDYAIPFNVPYKDGQNLAPEYGLKFYINKTINQVAFKNRSKGIEDAFKGDNKTFSNRAETILKNTIAFLEILKEE